MVHLRVELVIATALLSIHQRIAETNETYWLDEIRIVPEEMMSKYRIVDRLDYLGYHKHYFRDDEADGLGTKAIRDSNNLLLSAKWDRNEGSLKFLNPTATSNQMEVGSIQTLEEVRVNSNSRLRDFLTSLSPYFSILCNFSVV
jgi:hypothetical protein